MHPICHHRFKGKYCAAELQGNMTLILIPLFSDKLLSFKVFHHLVLKPTFHQENIKHGFIVRSYNYSIQV